MQTFFKKCSYRQNKFLSTSKTSTKCVTGTLRNLGKAGSCYFFRVFSSYSEPLSYPLLTLHLTLLLSPLKNYTPATMGSLQFYALGLSDTLFPLPRMPLSRSGWITFTLSQPTIPFRKEAFSCILPHLSHPSCVLLFKRLLFDFMVSFTRVW